MRVVVINLVGTDLGPDKSDVLGFHIVVPIYANIPPFIGRKCFLDALLPALC